MVKKATITWDGGAQVHDDLAIAVSVEPVGQRPASTCASTGTVDGAPVFTADLTYVAVRTGTTETVPVPDEFRARRVA